MSTEFIKSLPGYAGTRVPVRITELTKAHVQAWEETVVPYIHGRADRADAEWSWHENLDYLVLDPIERFTATGWAICAGPDQAFPVSLLLCFERFPDVNHEPLDCVFIAYLAAAPRECLEQKLEIEYRPKCAGRAALDVATVRAFAGNFDGRVGVHVAPETPDDLIDWYQKHGLKHLPTEQRLARQWPYLPPSDGRYLFYDTETALASLDELRSL